SACKGRYRIRLRACEVQYVPARPLPEPSRVLDARYLRTGTASRRCLLAYLCPDNIGWKITHSHHRHGLRSIRHEPGYGQIAVWYRRERSCDEKHRHELDKRSG